MLPLRGFAGVSVAMSLLVGLAVFLKTPEYKARFAPVIASASETIVAAGDGAASRAQVLLAEVVPAQPASPARIVAAPPGTPPHAAPAPHSVLIVAARTAPQRPLALAIEVSAPPLPPGVTAAVPAAPQAVTPDPALLAQESGAVAERVQLLVPPRLAAYFDLFLYVSKASEGPWAQRIFIFHKSADGVLGFEDSFAVSTGRERREKYFTSTPSGLFELDPNRFEPMHISRTWDRARMPWSMFFNYQVGEHMAGIALHAAVGRREDGDLGHRASGGCVRLPLDKADSLYHRIQATEQGLVPVLLFDAARDTTSISGGIAQDGAGNDLLSEGYKVLVVIDTIPGPAAGAALVSQNNLSQPRGNRLFVAAVNAKSDPDWDKSVCTG